MSVVEFDPEVGEMIRTRARGLVGMMIPSRLCCPPPGCLAPVVDRSPR